MSKPKLHVPPVNDFEVSGDGASPTWDPIEWTEMLRHIGDAPYESKFKVAYSPNGLYVLAHHSDQRISATMREDFMDLYLEDVWEVFLWPDESESVYFEYEISPLGQELVLLVPQFDGTCQPWQPWHYEGERRVRKKTAAIGGELSPGARVEGWTSEIFIPFALLAPLRNVPPGPGTRWRANFYRIDYDRAKFEAWNWSPVARQNFHDYQNFGALVFD